MQKRTFLNGLATLPFTACAGFSCFPLEARAQSMQDLWEDAMRQPLFDYAAGGTSCLSMIISLGTEAQQRQFQEMSELVKDNQLLVRQYFDEVRNPANKLNPTVVIPLMAIAESALLKNFIGYYQVYSDIFFWKDKKPSFRFSVYSGRSLDMVRNTLRPLVPQNRLALWEKEQKVYEAANLSAMKLLVSIARHCRISQADTRRLVSHMMAKSENKRIEMLLPPAGWFHSKEKPIEQSFAHLQTLITKADPSAYRLTDTQREAAVDRMMAKLK